MACEDIYIPSVAWGCCDRKTEGNAMAPIHDTDSWRIRTYNNRLLLS